MSYQYHLFSCCILQHTLNEGVVGKEIDVLLLDERFHRDTKPCHTRRDVCSLTKPYKTKYIWYCPKMLPPRYSLKILSENVVCIQYQVSS